MNANELADELENVDEGSGYLGVLSLEASTMLRQQQTEIERLTMLCDCMTTESNRKGNEIEALKDMLEKEGIGVSQKYLDERIAEMKVNK